MEAETVLRMIEEFAANSPRALVMEDGAVVFDLATARYSVAAEQGKCLLHLWSAERNAVRRVIGAERKADVLRLTVQRFGKPHPTTLELCRSADRRTPSARKRARSAYEQLLRRALERCLPGFTLEKISSAMDLERSFSPVYTRALLRRGNAALAVLGVNAQETQASIDAALTFGILWLDHCRARQERAHVEGLALFVPPGSSTVVRERMAHLDDAIAKWRLYELAERHGDSIEIDCHDRGNITTRLVRWVDNRVVEERFAAAIARLRGLLPEVEVAVLSAAEAAFRLRGLEFARARLAPDSSSFRHTEEIVFGLGGSETRLDDGTEERFALMLRQLAASRRPKGSRTDPLWRAAPERWLESLLARDVSAINPRLDPDCAYSQVPAFSASDRAMIDVLSITREGRLAVIELKAEEDIHLPLQGVDYWARVVWHQQRGEFEKFGYFPGRQLSREKPLLLLVAPALQVHPATDTLLRYLSPEIECELVGIDERWREEMRVVFRKRREQGRAAGAGRE